MQIKIAHIGDLRGMCFNIPDYQRGYRWETKQIHELLDDLLEFDNSKSGAFYCLQPLVVVENHQQLLSDETVFDVIDGQQRLTTIFLIINYLSQGDVPYRLRYDRACDKTQPLSFTNGEITYSRLKSLTNEDIENNPDYFYLSKAIKDIADWFDYQKIVYPKIIRKIDKMIMSDDYSAREKPFHLDVSEEDKNDGQRDVRFIWYDATIAGINYQGSISVFKRLNYGKTSLTAAELIKALLFQCDVYDAAQKTERRQVAFRMSTEWDRMEKELQNPFMWSMLAPEKKESISNIDFVLSYVASRLVEISKIEITSSPSDDDYDYIVFDKYIKNKLSTGLSYAEIVTELWAFIQDVFDVITSWYKEHELYHLIGLRLTLLNPKNKKRTQKERGEYNETLREMFEHFDLYSLQKFKDEQREKIGNIISLNKYNKNIDEGTKPFTLADLEYGQHDADLINVLLVYNVTLCMKNTQDKQYFPFWFYQNIIPSLEHIHPQHLHDETISFEIRCQWYNEKCRELDEMVFMDDSEKKEIEDARAVLDKVLLLSEEEINKGDKVSITTLNDKKKDYEANEEVYRTELKKIDRLFDELANISLAELHSIRNMALVDKNTNAALGNGLMATKRQKLMDLQSLFNETIGDEGAYTFIGTWKVFNKQFIEIKTKKTTDARSSNLLFWSKKDRDNYFADIETIYKEYVK